MSYNPNVLYDSGVLSSAAQTITVPSAAMSGVTCCKIEISHVISNATSETVQLFVNSDTTATNYNRELLFGQGATPFAGNADSPDCSVSVATSNAFTIVNVSVVAGMMMFSSVCSREGSTGDMEIFTIGGNKKTGTVTDLQGMTLTTTNANGWGVGSRVVVYKN